MHEHSYFCAVDVPGDVEFVEFVMSDSYGLERFMRESKEAGVSFQEYTNNKYREWCDDRKGKDYLPLSRQEKG